MPSLLDMNVMDTPDLEVQKEGEYKVRLIKASIKEAKSGTLGLTALFDLPEVPNAKLIQHWMGLESKEDSTLKQRQDDARKLKSFLQAFGFEQGPLNDAARSQRTSPVDKGTVIEEWANSEGYAILGIQPAEGQYSESNTISRFVISR